ncbi:aspartate-semialdehyde dehydrogenase [Humisphaera borealis]|uniref:Aspartate-semialdehyde dehydrogenase n=1 Tax=Humisphaera borealis TaxID=2807512 RepID=A0A7M2X5Q6_9BACT|nr:aspartate-semialdehyde dehydrogenase [Humisphaera borealis]QOV92140.1 aspartate-semialdehyde dehydrogenase [Humisphaera borealis]
MSVNVAVVGATGAVGQEFLTVLAERNFPIKNLKLLASARSAGKTATFNGKEYLIEELTKDSFKDVQIALFSAGGSISKEFAPAAVSAGAVVVDNSSAFRMKEGVPLVVPEVNPEAIHKHNGVIANPNCSTIIMNVAVWPLYKVNKVKRVIVSTYQAVSGAGAWGLYELEAQQKAFAAGQPILKEKFPHQIFNNVFSHNSKVADNGYNEEENKMVLETRKIFGDPKIMITATCVRVPIPRAHSESINVEFERPITADQVRQILSKAPGIKIVDDPANNYFPMPLETSNQDLVYAGRIRQDISRDDGKGIDLFVSGDQIRKGAATNAVQIAERLV